MKATFKYNSKLPFIKENIKGNEKIDDEFIFLKRRDRLPYQRFIKWITERNPQKKEKKTDKYIPEVISTNSFLKSKEDKIVWLGHSSFYIQLNGIRLLTDPIFYNINPLLKRRHPIPCKTSDFTNIDYILLSHGHRDHLDSQTLKKLLQYNPNVEVLCLLGFTKMLRKMGFKHIQEAAWWQQYHTKKITIDFLPAKHWNRRFINDYNTTLWGSFAIQSNATSIYFAGDTGYAHHFKEINEQYKSFDYCLMPIGAYKPRYIMEWAHVSPEESVQAFHELKGKMFIPMHYGTFDLSDEPASEPVKLMQEMKNEKKLNGKLAILKIGQPLEI